MALDKKFLLMILAVSLIALPASAQEYVSSHGDWHLFTTRMGGEKVCYIVTEPNKSTGNFSNRGTPYLMITQRNASTDEVSTSSGYPYKVDSKAMLEVDGTKFDLFTKDSLAWAYDAPQDTQIVTAMKKGNRVTVRGTSPRDTFSLDTYSLRGVTAAHNALRAQCK